MTTWNLRANSVHPQLLRRYNGKPRPTSSVEWLRYFTVNAERDRCIPWNRGVDAPRNEIEVVIPSLQAWQLGETSDGSHLTAVAKKYAASLEDDQFLKVVRLFIKEEQRHGEILGKFLDLVEAPRIKKNWGDSLFRAVRYSIQTMEVWATTVVMIETMALIYYRAVHDATSSTVLRLICRQILRDEVPHVRFQYERLAILHRKRAKLSRVATACLQRILFTAICLSVWAGHSKVFRAAGHTFSSYWARSWRCMRRAWRGMSPDQYDWAAYVETLTHEDELLEAA